MSLIKCPECERQVSDQAQSCPHCGYPLRKPEFTTVELVYDDGLVSGQRTLDERLAAAWQVISADDVDTWTYEKDGETIYCRKCRYSLRK